MRARASILVLRVIFAFLAAAALLAVDVPAWAGAALTEVSGAVLVHYQEWEPVTKTPYPLEDGATVRTAAQGRATVTFSDGSRVELAGNSAFTVEETEPASYSLGLSLGRLKAFVAHVASRSFKIRTPTAVCAVRGTEFMVEVQGDGSTNVELYKGLLAIDDQHGREVLIHPGERSRVDTRGLRAASAPATRRQAQRERLRGALRRELALDTSRRRIQAAAVRELKLADYQQGKTAMNVFGQLVRVEEYIVRPSPDQFKLVVLNSSRELGFNYFYYLGTFNTTLPTDLSVALSQLSGTVGSPPTYYLTSFETVRSNTTDSVVELANGGHPVNVNNNASNDPGQAVTSYFNPGTNTFVTLAPGTAFYKTLFDNDGLYVDGVLKSGWTGSGILTYSPGFGVYGPTPASTQDPITGATLATSLPLATQTATFPNPGTVQQLVYDSYGDGTFLQWNNYIANNQGQVATFGQFSASSTGPSFTQQLLNFNYEQVITASEFGGRKIDLLVAPKILVQSGLIQ
ncbi:MAG: FecR domain-containing protein [Elusimicrobiota bacterium]